MSFYVVPALLALKSSGTKEVLSTYKHSFKMLLDKKFPNRSDEESCELYREYLPRLSDEIAKRVLNILDQKFVPSCRYINVFQSKYVHVHDEFFKKDGVGCKLSKEEWGSISKKSAVDAYGLMKHRFCVQKAIEDHVSLFLSPYRNGLIAPNEDVPRQMLIVRLEQVLHVMFKQIPFKTNYIELKAMRHYFFESSQYILDQYEEQIGVIPSFEESKKDEKCRIIFRACVEAVLDAIEIDFPNIPFNTGQVILQLDELMKRNERMKSSVGS